MTHPQISTDETKYAPQAKWRSKNQQAVWAQAALRSALKRGLLEQKPCRMCGSADSEAHHSDYNRPMAVDWLCRAHHKAEHARLKIEGGAQ